MVLKTLQQLPWNRYNVFIVEQVFRRWIYRLQFIRIQKFTCLYAVSKSLLKVTKKTLSERETSDIFFFNFNFCSANQWNGFYMVGTSVMKELSKFLVDWIIEFFTLWFPRVTLHPLHANPTKWSNMFDHFVASALKGLTGCKFRRK